MSHARTAIRTQAAAILTGLPTTASRVYTSQVYPLTVVPALRIYTGDDAMRGQQVISRAYEDRAVQLVIECHVKQTTDLEDTLDTMAGEIEQALANNRKLNDTAKDCFFSGSPAAQLSDESDQPTATRIIVLSVWYRIDPANPGVSL